MDIPSDEKPKDVEFYAATVTAWYGTRLEHDRSLLTLSAGGVALLITLLTTVGVSSAEGLVLYIAALVSFATCLGAILLIFKYNARYLESVVKPNAPLIDPQLQRLDNVALAAFAIGVAFAMVIGISAAVSSFTMKGKAMTDEISGAGNSRSFDGATNMKPSDDLQKSFNGAANMKPAPASQTSAPANPPGQTSTQSTSQNQGGDKK